MSCFRDLTNKEFGRLRAIEKIGTSSCGWVLWRCYCDPALGGCGKYHNVYSHNLISGTTKSCGCLRREILTKGRQRGLKQTNIVSRRNNLMRSIEEGWSKSGYKGVYYVKGTNKWRVRIRSLDGKSVSYGCYSQIDDAIRVAREVLDERKKNFIKQENIKP